MGLAQSLGLGEASWRKWCFGLGAGGWCSALPGRCQRDVFNGGMARVKVQRSKRLDVVPAGWHVKHTGGETRGVDIFA